MAVELLPAQHRVVVSPEGGRSSLLYTWNPLPYFSLDEARGWSGIEDPAAAYNFVAAGLAEELVSLRSSQPPRPALGASGVDVSEPDERSDLRASNAPGSPRAGVAVYRDEENAVLDSAAEVRAPLL